MSDKKPSLSERLRSNMPNVLKEREAADEIDRLTQALDEFREFHTAAMIAIGKALEVDVTDEPRCKWVALEASRLRADLAALKAQEPVAWVNSSDLISAKIARARGGQFDSHTWSEAETSFHNTPVFASPVPPAPDWKTAFEEEARKFQAETLLTSTAYQLLRRWVERGPALGCTHEPWPKACATCDLLRESKALLETPINIPTQGKGDALSKAIDRQRAEFKPDQLSNDANPAPAQKEPGLTDAQAARWRFFMEHWATCQFHWNKDASNSLKSIGMTIKTAHVSGPGSAGQLEREVDRAILAAAQKEAS